MEKFQRYYLSFLLLIVYTNTIAQVNCNAVEGENCKKASELYNWAPDSLGSAEFQKSFEKAVGLCPDFSDSYIDKTYPYLKSGDFITWKILIDKAIAVDSKIHLGYRGLYKFQFQQDYDGFVRNLKQLKKYYPNPGRSLNGDDHPEMIKFISYNPLGQKEKAVEDVENLLASKSYFKGMYGHYQLGVTYFELGRYHKASENFENQSKEYDFAENTYFKSKVSKIRNKDYLDLKTLALRTYDEDKT